MYSPDLSNNLQKRLHGAPHSHNSSLFTHLLINNALLTSPQIDTIRMPPGLLLTAQPLAQLPELIHMLPISINVDQKTLLRAADGSGNTKAREEDDLDIRHYDRIVAPVSFVIGTASHVVYLLEIGPGGGQRELLVDAVEVFPAGIVGVEELFELSECGCWLEIWRC